MKPPMNADPTHLGSFYKNRQNDKHFETLNRADTGLGSLSLLIFIGAYRR